MRARLVPAVLAACVAVAGCAGDEPDAGPTLPPVTSTPSASPSAVAVPTEATPATPEGAAEFVRFFYAQVEMAYATEDSSLVSALAVPGCTACARFVESIDRLRDKNERVDGLTYEIVSAVAPPVNGDTARVDVVYNGPEVVRYDSSNNVVNREPAAQLVNEQVDLVLVERGWRVREVQRP